MIKSLNSAYRISSSIRILVLLVMCHACILVQAEDMPVNEDVTLNENIALDEALQQLKKDVLALNRDLFILKEELLFPANTQVAVFLSLDVGEFFDLDAVNVKIDGKHVASHLYTSKQLDALVRGGVQRLYLGNIKNGEHEIIAVFTGRGPKGRDYRRAVSLDFEKNANAKHLELTIKDSEKILQPEFAIKVWE